MGRKVLLPIVNMSKPLYYDLGDSEVGLDMVWCVAPLSRFHAGSCTKTTIEI